MKKLGIVPLLQVLLTVVLISFISLPLTAQPGRSLAQAPSQQPLAFKAPKGYLPGELSKHTGKLFLDPNRPAGMFVGYPSEGQNMAAFTTEMQKKVLGMFWSGSIVVWDWVTLPSHKGIESESGTLMTASGLEMDIQLAFYVRADKGVAYGYYAMRHKKSKGDDGKFLDAAGAGVKAFDELAMSIGGHPGN